MNNILHDYLNKLRIISTIRPGQRLDTTSGLNIYEPTIISWILRKWYHDNKDEGIRYLQDLYKGIDQTVEPLSRDISTILDAQRRNRIMHVIINMAENIHLSITGLENLSKTYTAYPQIIASIRGIVQDFAIETYFYLLNSIIPKEDYTHLLKQNIMYEGKIIYKGITVDEINLGT